MPPHYALIHPNKNNYPHPPIKTPNPYKHSQCNTIDTYIYIENIWERYMGFKMVKSYENWCGNRLASLIN
jgi:hypothetical protein